MKRVGAILLALLLLGVIGVGVWYTQSQYAAQEEALACIASPAQGISVLQEEKRIVFAPDAASAGFVFYPGGNVDWHSYAPLMEALAQRGIFCVLVKMPLNLAILDMDAAEGIAQAYPSVERWYIGGHSLGGFAASAHVHQAHADYEGLILLAAYTQSDLRDTGLEALSIYGSADGVLNMENYAGGLLLLPEGFEEIVLDGGCHSYFGAYGMQAGDGVPSISREEQMRRTVDAVAAFMQ